MAATIKIVKKRTTRFKCVRPPDTISFINLVPGVTNLTATRASRRTGGNQRVLITESAGDSRDRLPCPRFAHTYTAVHPYPWLNFFQIGYGSNKKVGQRINVFPIELESYPAVDATPSAQRSEEVSGQQRAGSRLIADAQWQIRRRSRTQREQPQPNCHLGTVRLQVRVLLKKSLN